MRNTSTMAAVFPGQGSQHPGMGGALLEAFPTYLRPLWQESEDIMGVHLGRIMQEGSDPHGKETLVQWAQPALFLVSLAVLMILEREGGLSILDFSCVAGHSLGEYSALCAAGVITFSQGLALIKKRQETMRGLSPKGSMAAILGLRKEELSEHLSCILKKEEEEASCYISNHNSPEQSVLSGTPEVLQKVCAMIHTQVPGRSVKTISLSVSGPFHCPLMMPAQNAFNQWLQENIAIALFAQAKIPVISNTSAESSVLGERLKEALCAHMISPVLWCESQHTMVQHHGVQTFVEIGPGKVLAGLGKKTFPQVKTFSLNDPAGIKEFSLSYSHGFFDARR